MRRLPLRFLVLVMVLVAGVLVTLIIAKHDRTVVPPPAAVVEPTFWPERAKLEKEVLSTYNVYPDYIAYVFDSVEANAKKYKVPPVFIVSVIEEESSFSFDAVSSKSCKGLMQINYPTWSTELRTAGIAVSEKQLYDPKVNIEAGTYILAKLLKQSNNNPEVALGKYFGADNKAYAGKVLNTIGQYTMVCALN